ncbi:hypothetical protein FVEN_g12744 [Fusarium venenatum]|nr:hypothetical protein FVEN_g12744 [Fusarium venenatum]
MPWSDNSSAITSTDTVGDDPNESQGGGGTSGGGGGRPPPKPNPTPGR